MAGQGKVWSGIAGLVKARHGMARIFFNKEIRMRFEIDVSGLQAGDVIDVKQCESIIGIHRAADQYQYNFALMQLADHVQKLLWKSGNQWTVATGDGEIRILTHEQASQYNQRHFQASIAKMRRCHRRMAAVNVGVLDKETRRIHGELLSKQTRILAGMKERARSIEPVAFERKDPVRVVGKK